MPLPVPRGGTAVPRPSLVIARILSGLFLILGIVGVLRAVGDQGRADGAIDFIVFTISPGIAYLHLALGLAGVALTASGRRGTAVYLSVTAAVLLLWAAAAAIADGDGVLMRDGALIVLHLAAGLAAAAGAAWMASHPARISGDRSAGLPQPTEAGEPAER